MLYLTCTTITSIDLAHYGVSRAKDWVSVKCGTSNLYMSTKEKKKHVVFTAAPPKSTRKIHCTIILRNIDVFVPRDILSVTIAPVFKAPD